MRNAHYKIGQVITNRRNGLSRLITEVHETPEKYSKFCYTYRDEYSVGYCAENTMLKWENQ